MAFCCEHPVVCLAGAGETDTFIVDVFEPRPSFDEMARFQSWGSDASQKMREGMDRKNCAVSWAQLVVDQHGFLALLKFKHGVQLGDAKKAATIILKCLPGAVEQNLRPLDEVDRDRICAWATVESLRPKRPRPQEEGDKDEENKVFFKRRRKEDAEPVPHAEPQKKTAKELLAELASDDEGEAEVAERPRLMLTQDASQSAAPSTVAPLDELDPASVWEHRAKEEATIVLAEAGARPDSIMFIRCHREDRRQLLLQGRVKQEFETATLLTVVRVAMQLAKDGKMPGVGKHGRTCEFMERCSTALAALNLVAERVVTRLPSGVQALIRGALGGDGPAYGGCFSPECLNKPAAWLRVIDAMCRCARCKCLMAFGRTVTCFADVLGPERLRRQPTDMLRVSACSTD